MCVCVRMIQQPSGSQRWWLVVGHTHAASRPAQYRTEHKHTHGGHLFPTRFAADRFKKETKACGWRRGPDVFSVVFGIARWRSAGWSVLQAGWKDAAVRVSWRGQSIQSSFSRLPLPPPLPEDSVPSSGLLAGRVRRQLTSSLASSC